MDKQNIWDNLNIFPAKKDKSPAVRSWKVYAQKKYPFEELSSDIFGVCGGVDGLEIIDIDNHFLDSDKILQYVSDNHDLDKFFIVKTQSGGYHIYYRCEKPEVNQKLASIIWTEQKTPDGREWTLRNGKTQVVKIETRGVGGYVIYYDDIIQGSVDNIPTISMEERDDLISVCRSLNEVEQKTKRSTHQVKQEQTDKPGDLYNNDPASIQKTKDLLIAHGWTELENGYWRRPGKEKGISATFGRVGENKFYVFSSNAHPFDIDSHTMFGVKAILEHNGDFSECAKDLIDLYKPKKSKKSSSQKTGEKQLTKHDVLRKVLEDWKTKIRYNYIHKRYEFYNPAADKWDSDTDYLIGRVANEMEDNRYVVDGEGKRKPINITSTKVFDMIKSNTISDIYNPIISFFKSLPVYDGQDHIDRLMNYIELPKDESRQFFYTMFKKHLIRACRCALESEYSNRFVLVFHGGQEIGKSRFWQWIINSELYYDDPIEPGDKDSILALSRYMIVNIDDMDSLRRDEVAKLKAFISKGQITKRISYGKNDIKFERHATIVASTNESEILIDTTNTRWLILKVKSFDWRAYIKEINPLMLWAQVYDSFKKDNESGELSQEEKDQRELRNNREFLQSTPERDFIMAHFEAGNDKYNSSEVFEMLQNKHPNVRLNMNQLRRELHRMYGNPHNTRRNGTNGRYYYLRSIGFEAQTPTPVSGAYGEKDDELPF